MNLLLDPKPLAAAYQAAQPFPHAVIDGAFHPGYLDSLRYDFPEPEDPHWARHATAVETKLTTKTDQTLPGWYRMHLQMLNSSTFIDFLETLTGIKGLIPDPHFEGAGPHCTLQGGRLGVHTDYRFNKRLGLDRRVNALLYLNEDWKEEDGGHLELWSHRTGRRGILPGECVQRIAPTFGRLVVFNTTDYSFHGHPEPYRGPARRSIAMYYFTAGRPASEVWVPEGGQHTLFYPRPGSADADPQAATRWILRHPTLYRGLRKVRDIFRRNP